MRIVTYDLEKNENDMPMLVKESSQNCPSISNSITDPGEAVAVLNQALQLDRKMEEHFCLIAMRSKKVIFKGVYTVTSFFILSGICKLPAAGFVDVDERH